MLPTTHDGQRAPGLRFGEPRTMALLASVAAFSHVVGGLTNKTLRAQMAVLWSPDYSQGQASYDLRRLRLKGFIERVAHTNTYRVTAHGRSMATFFTKLASRVVVPGLTELVALVRPPKATPQSRCGMRGEPTTTSSMPWSESFSWREPRSKTCLKRPRLKAQAGLRRSRDSLRSLVIGGPFGAVGQA